MEEKEIEMTEELKEIWQKFQIQRRQQMVERFFQEEAIRIKMPKPQWDFMHSYNLDEIIAEAIKLGWEENKVQVKKYQVTKEVVAYYIEPFEKDCNCPDLLRYEDYRPQ